MTAARRAVLSAVPERWGTARRVAAVAAMGLLLVVGVRALATPYTVHGSSMEPSAGQGDLLVASSLLPPQRGAVVVVTPPASWGDAAGGEEHLAVKRVIGVAGDRVSCCDRESGALVRNGVVIVEDYVANGDGSALAFDVVVPDGHVWLLGDNRARSRDSRMGLAAPGNGAVPVSAVRGVVWLPAL